MILRFHPMARRDLKRAFEWYLERSPQAASNLLIRFDEAAQHILASPQISPLTDLGHRKALLKKYPYSIIFFWRGDFVTIVAVAHAKRKRSFWHNRIIEETP
jgi:plasmid stabilization system protein ParE